MKKIVLILFALLPVFLAGRTFGQKHDQQFIDSLVVVLKKAKDDTNKVNSLLSYFSAIRDINPDSAFNLSLQALHLSEKLSWKPGIGQCYHHIATIYGMKGNYTGALQYFSKAMAIWNSLEHDAPQNMKNGIRNQESKTLGNIGMVYWRKGAFKEALDVDFKVLKIDMLTGNQKYLAMHEGNLGNVYKSLGDYSNALGYELKALDINEQLQDEKGIATILGNIGSIYVSLKKYPEAEKYMLQSLDISYQERDLYEVMEVSNNLSELYSQVGQDKKALEYYKKTVAVKDTLFNEQRAEEINSREIRYEFDKKEAVEKAIHEKKVAEIKRTRNLQYTATLAFVLLAIFLFLANRHKQKANKILQKTLSDLKAAQAQLIQSAKMVSLGELTAGIAHEIQNPLNFVNNFSEVNNELLREMKEEMNKGNLDDAHTIANDVISNAEKINHHGKRADSIVKGMLQHSVVSNGQKEPTDINTLVSQYLRLSYHGIRAKDNSFNPTLNTNFDEHIGKISIIPQEIGRVILNLTTNAFYEVNAKRLMAVNTQAGNGYEPVISVSTKKTNHQIEISVADNGNGIPSSIKDKIFQPFFTTKPTGQGTGLGLSLSYDIVKAHGGEIKVETNEGEGTTFIIQLPVA